MKQNVLIVDDDTSVRESLSKVLREENYEVALAADGQEAVQRFKEGRIDLLLLDLGLPIRSGWDVFEHITSENPLMPIIVITGQPDQYPLAVAAGVGALLEKPLDVSRLLQTMQQLLSEPRDFRLRRLCGYLGEMPHIPSENTKFLRKLRERHKVQFRNNLGMEHR